MGQIRKKIFLVLFVCCISLLASSMILFAMPSRYVNADEKIFSMVKGASCCLYDQGGIRFVVKMDRATANELKAEESTKSLHFIIGSRQNFDAVISANDEYINLVNGSTKYAHLVDIEKGKIYEEDGYFYANGCIWGLLENHRTLEWCAIAFISDGSGNVEYANFENNDINTSTRSFSFVLKKALLDENETRFDKIVETYSWIGTEDYKIEITTLDEYNDLLAKKQSFPDKYNSLIYNISATQTYTVNTITKKKNGNIQNSSFSNEAVIGDTVTISPEINDDYELQSIKVVNSNNEDVDIKDRKSVV